MKLIVGLGNPGTEFDLTRHNFGYAILDQLSSSLDAPAFKAQKKFLADTCEVNHRGDKLILVKPTTYMNLSGKSIGSIVQFYKIAARDVWVVHDELDLPFSVMRVKQGGSDAGHNGLKSISSAIGPDYWRFRLGIANSTLRSPIAAADFVLQKFNDHEQEKLEAAVTKATDQILLCRKTPASLHVPEIKLF